LNEWAVLTGVDPLKKVVSRVRPLEVSLLVAGVLLVIAGLLEECFLAWHPSKSTTLTRTFWITTLLILSGYAVLAINL
jgi:hypothetical protein